MNGYTWERQWHKLVLDVIDYGEDREDRTGVGTRSLFGPSLDIDLRLGFPLLTTRRMSFRALKAELEWMLSGSSDVKELHKRGVTVWDEWATEQQCARFGRRTGDLGPVYGELWRWFPTGNRAGNRELADCSFVDQLSELITGLRENPWSRRHIMTAWDPHWSRRVAVPPCPCLLQLYVSKSRYVDMQVYQRSCDTFLGGPWDIAQYALLLYEICRMADVTLVPRRLLMRYGDCHVYKNHFYAFDTLLNREPKPCPKLMRKGDDWQLHDYNYWPEIKAEVAV